MGVKIFLYPLSIRIWHWLNAVLCLLLIITGISMQYSNPEYPFMRFDLAVTLHNIFGITLTVSYVFFIIINITTNNIKFYKVQLKGFKNRLITQSKYYSVGIFKGQKTPFPISEKRKFNPLQKFSYILVMYVFFPLIFITGWALIFPETIIHDVFGISGIHLTDLLHVIIGFFVSVFMFVHIYFCTIGTSIGSNFKAMLNGWHE
ncbi:MAG: cytochrome b/b6 domain-containing protein [Bacteroidales bacterium]|nr:cytochrome b/b6 domain-containing protein [Bacteroidales bacterium]